MGEGEPVQHPADGAPARLAGDKAATPPIAAAARRSAWARVTAWGARPAAWGARTARIAVGGVRWVWRLAVVAVVALVLGNALFSAPTGAPARGLDPQSALCQDGFETGWDVLQPRDKAYVANDEWAAIDSRGAPWRAKFACAIQRHILRDSSRPEAPPLSYDLAFLEFQEDGKPFVVRNPCSGAGCLDEGYGPVARGNRFQLEALMDHLCQKNADGACAGGPHYVMAFVHGWRHNAGVGDSNVSELRHYAAHVARFLRDRARPGEAAPRVTAVFIGWRGARTDETRLRRQWGAFGAQVGSALAVLTLFDRKPVSETIAPSVLSALRAIEQTLGLARPPDGAPSHGENRMIVFGHSLGGNMLATALHDDLVKAVARHQPGAAFPPPLGDLVVLINPASEATKWTDVQRALWRRIAVSASERRPPGDYAQGHAFFRPDQRPVVLATTAARDWPPGGLRERDCAPPPVVGTAREKLAESRKLAAERVDYDWATYDLFPAFKFDLRPLADTAERAVTGRDPHDSCAAMRGDADGLLRRGAVALIDLARFAPFQQTDPEQTRTIGHFDPPRAARGTTRTNFFSARPFGTTHELRGREDGVARYGRDRTAGREIPVDYDMIAEPVAACPSSAGWLTSARARRLAEDPRGHATFWISAEAEDARQPALVFQHGFKEAGLSPITRASDPFWNMRAFDSALARHDGYMLSSFICAMNQLVMDDPSAPPPAPNVAPAPSSGAAPAPAPSSGAAPAAVAAPAGVAPERAE